MESKKKRTDSLFPARLKVLRREKGIGQKDLALHLGLRQSAVANYEQGIRFPEEATLTSIADYFGVSLDYLLGRGDRERGVTPEPVSVGKIPAKREITGKDVSLLMENLLTGDKVQARMILLELWNGGNSLRELYLNLFIPVLEKTGVLWEKGIIDVAKEHFISEEIRRLLGLFSGLTEKKKLKSKTVISACAPGELHCLGLRMFSDLLEAEGWTVLFLGTDVPAKDLIDLCSAHKADLVALSATLPNHLESLKSTIEALRRDPSLAEIRIIVGGAAFNRDLKIYKALAADGYAADIVSGCRVAEDLVKEKGKISSTG